MPDHKEKESRKGKKGKKNTPESQGAKSKGSWGSGVKYAIAAVVIAGIVLGGVAYMLLNPAPAAVIPADLTTTTNNRNKFTGANVTGAINYIYGANTTDLSATEIDALVFTDYELLGTNNSEDTFVPKENYTYIIRSTAAGYNEYWWEPVLGAANDLAMLPLAINISATTFSETFATNLKDDNVNTTANTTQTNWRLVYQTQNSTGINDTCGFAPLSDFSGGETKEDFEVPNMTNYFLFNITLCNNITGGVVTANATWLDITNLDDADFEIVNSTTYLIVKFYIDITGFNYFDLVFDNAIGTDFNVKTVEMGYGASGSYGHLNYL
jgi:hypothetical protein